jgi:hypothetical protein
MSATPLKTPIPKLRAEIPHRFLFLAAGLVVGYLAGFRQKTVDVMVLKTIENEQMRFADEGMLRSRTNFERPGITSEQVTQIKMISGDYGIPEDMLYAFYKTEKGRMGLYLGASWVDPEIRQRYTPLMWQFAKGAKTWNQHLNKTVMFDPYLNRRALWSFAKQWNPDPGKWSHDVLENLDFVRRNGLEVTEPPKPRPAKVPVKKDVGKPQKANGSAHKSPTHKEKR